MDNRVKLGSKGFLKQFGIMEFSGEIQSRESFNPLEAGLVEVERRIDIEYDGLPT